MWTHKKSLSQAQAPLKCPGCGIFIALTKETDCCIALTTFYVVPIGSVHTRVPPPNESVASIDRLMGPAQDRLIRCCLPCTTERSDVLYIERSSLHLANSSDRLL